MSSRYHPDAMFNPRNSNNLTLSRSQILPRSVSEYKAQTETQRVNVVKEKQRLTLSQILVKTKKSPVKGNAKTATPTKVRKMSLEKSPLKKESQLTTKEENNIQDIMSFIEKFRLEKQKTLEQNQRQVNKGKVEAQKSNITPKKSALTNKSTKQKATNTSTPKTVEQKRKEYQLEMQKSQKQRMQVLKIISY